MSWELGGGGGRSHDRWLKDLRRQLATVDRPVFLTFHHEPENDARRLGQTPADFVAMQTRIIELFARRAPKVTIVPILQSWTLRPGEPACASAIVECACCQGVRDRHLQPVLGYAADVGAL